MRSGKKEGMLRKARVRRAVKLWALPALAAIVGLILRLRHGYAPVDILLDWVGALPDLATPRREIPSRYPAVYEALSWVAAPLLFAVLAAMLVRLLKWTGLLDRFFPDPPSFVFADLDAERAAASRLMGGLVPPFVGRDDELAELVDLLASASRGAAFQWRSVTGPSGLGKSRLAIEWLAQAQARKWDVGVMDPEDSELLLEWRARKPTALVIDEAQTQWSGELERALVRLRDGAHRRRPVRVLVVAQAAPYRAGTAPDGLDAEEAAPPLALAPLWDDDVARLADALGAGERGETIAEASGGNPLAAALMISAGEADSLPGALAHWVYRLIPELRREDPELDVDLVLGICLSVIGGPVDRDIAGILWPGFRTTPLLRLTGESDRAALSRHIAPLRPDMLGDALALAVLPHLPTPLFDAMVDRLLALNPDRVEAFLGRCWAAISRSGTLSPSELEPPERIAAMQARFDAAWLDRRDEQQARAEVVRIAMAEEGLTPQQWDDLTGELLHLIECRPFSVAIRVEEARAAANAITYYGRAGADGQARAFDRLEAWGDRLTALAADAVLGRDPRIRRAEAMAVAIAIDDYGRAGAGAQAGAFERLEAWGSRLTALTTDAVLGRDAAIRREEARAIVNAVAVYGQAGAAGHTEAFARLEAWGDRLKSLLADTVLGCDATIRFEGAKAAKNAIGDYGQAGVAGRPGAFERLETWGDQLAVLAAGAVSDREPEIQQMQARGIVNAIYFYGKAGVAGRTGAIG